MTVMPMSRRFLIALILMATTAGVFGYAIGGAQADAIIALERTALERWGEGNPDGFLSTYADEVTYFDPTQERRVNGRAAMASLLAQIRGKIRIDRFEMVNTKVQRHGDIAVLTYNLVDYARQLDGTERQTRLEFNSGVSSYRW
jgi:ketosteroid isomerase-like protein